MFNWINKKSKEEIKRLVDETSELKEEVNELKEELVSKSALNDSLMAFTDGRVEYWDIGGDNRYKDHFAIYKGIDLLANLGAGLKPNIYSGDNLLDQDAILQPNAFNIFQPNPNMSFNELIYTALIYFFYRGEFMIEISEEPYFHLKPLNPENMERLPNKYDWRYQLNSERRIIPGDTLIYVKLLNPDNDERGLGPIDVVKADLDNEKNAVKYNTGFFKNWGQIGGFFYDDQGKARPDDIEKIVKQFDSVHRGSQNAYKTLGLPGGIRYEDFAKTMVEMQYLESRKDIRDRILGILGIHKALFGITDQVNRSVSEEATRMLWLHNLKPKMLRIQEKINQTLFRGYYPNYTFKYDFSDIAELKQSIESITTQARLLRELGYTTNEINAKLKLEMDDIDDPIGDMRFIPNTLIPVDDLMFDEEVQSTDEGSKEEEKSFTTSSSKVEVKGFRKNKKQYRYIRKYNKLMRSSSSKMAGTISKFFVQEYGKVVKAVMARLNNKAGVSIDINLLLVEIQKTIDGNKDNLQKKTEPVYREVSIDADELALFAIDKQEKAQAKEELIAKLSNKIKDISNHTYRLIRTQVKDGFNKGETIDQITQRIRNVYKFNTSRARMIARTEVGSIVHKTTDIRYQDEGVEKKQWISAEDEKVRDTHIINNSIGVVDYDYIYPNGQKFPNDGEGGARENINCRCTFIPVIED